MDIQKQLLRKARACMLLMGIAASGFIAQADYVSPNGWESTEVERNGSTIAYYACPSKSELMTRGEESEEDRVNITANLTITGGDVPIYGYALASDNEDYPTTYTLMGIRTGATECMYIGEIPKGTYDLLFFLSGNNGDILLGQSGVEIYSDTELSFGVDQATELTNYVVIGPDGEEIMRLRYDDNEEIIEGNCDAGIDIHCYWYKNYPCPMISATSMGNGDMLFSFRKMPEVNFTSLGIMSVRLMEYGVVNTQIEMDYSKENNETTGGTWMSYEPEFAPSPFSIEYKKLTEDDSNSYEMLTDGIAWCAIGDYFVSGAGCNYSNIKDKVWSWGRYDDSAEEKFNSFMFIGSQGWSLELSTRSLPMIRSKEGLKFSGQNFTNLNGLLLTTERGKRNIPGNPRLQALAEDVPVLGDACPIISTFFYDDEEPYGVPFTHYYLGRYGEVRNADSALLSRFFEDENLELVGTETNSMKFYADGELECSSYQEAAQKDWFAYDDCDMLVEVVDYNVLVDGMSGRNNAEIGFRWGNEDPLPPTVTSLQIRNNQDKVTDYLAAGEGAFIEIFAADFFYKQGENRLNQNYAEEFLYLDTNPIKELKVEYAPTGTVNFVELPVEEIPELFYMPGYGYCYRANLDNVVNNGEAQWYDIRVTVADMADNYQRQTLTPAFKIDPAMVSVGELRSDIESMTNMEVWTIDGTLYKKSARKEDLKNLPKGLYILRANDKVVKYLSK